MKTKNKDINNCFKPGDILYNKGGLFERNTKFFIFIEYTKPYKGTGNWKFCSLGTGQFYYWFLDSGGSERRTFEKFMERIESKKQKGNVK